MWWEVCFYVASDDDTAVYVGTESQERHVKMLQKQSWQVEPKSYQKKPNTTTSVCGWKGWLYTNSINDKQYLCFYWPETTAPPSRFWFPKITILQISIAL